MTADMFPDLAFKQNDLKKWDIISLFTVDADRMNLYSVMMPQHSCSSKKYGMLCSSSIVRKLKW